MLRLKDIVRRALRAFGYDIVARSPGPPPRRIVNAHYRGHRFRCYSGDAQCEYILRGKGWDNQLDDILNQIDQGTRNHIVEIGANIGGSLVPRALDHPSLVFHCVEPVPEFFTVLSENAASYGAPNVKLYNRAVSGTQGELVRIHTQLGTAGAVAEYDNHTPFGVVESVASTVDAMFEGVPVGLLKIDTDGFEPSVLAGAKETIRRWRPLLFMEFHPALLRKAGSDPRAVVGLLRQFGYEEVTIWTNQGDLVERAASLDALLGHAEAALHYVDVLLRPKAISST